MSIVVGTNSYITLEEANELIEAYLVDSDVLRVAWEAASNANKTVYLLMSCMQLETLPFNSAKEDSTQVLSFPRTDGDTSKIQIAQALQAASLTNVVQQDETNQRATLRASGVKSFKIGNLSETFESGGPRSSRPLIFSTSLEVLQKYLTGGYPICISHKQYR